MYISTDNFVMDVMDTLTATMDIWAEQDKLSQVKNALYLNLMDKRIYKDDGPDRCLPTEYVDDTPRVIETFLRCLRLEKRTERTIEMYRGGGDQQPVCVSAKTLRRRDHQRHPGISVLAAVGQWKQRHHNQQQDPCIPVILRLGHVRGVDRGRRMPESAAEA